MSTPPARRRAARSATAQGSEVDRLSGSSSDSTQSVSAAESTLLAIGLRPAEPVRFRPLGSRRWVVGKVSRVESDGSITLRDPDGAARSFRADAIEVRRPGQRGRLVWRVVRDVAVTWEQLDLFDPRPNP